MFVGRNGKPVSNHTFQKSLDDIVKTINAERKTSSEKNKITYEPIEHVHPHALRHTFATRCFEAGMEAKSVQMFLGHFSISITLDLYTHVTDDKQREELNKLENLYQKAN